MFLHSALALLLCLQCIVMIVMHILFACISFDYSQFYSQSLHTASCIHFLQCSQMPLCLHLSCSLCFLCPTLTFLVLLLCCSVKSHPLASVAVLVCFEVTLTIVLIQNLLADSSLPLDCHQDFTKRPTSNSASFLKVSFPLLQNCKQSCIHQKHDKYLFPFCQA